MDETEDIEAAEEYVNVRFKKEGNYWYIAREAFLAGIKWRSERRDNG